MSTIYEPNGTARINNPAHRFRAAQMSYAARQAAMARGLATVGSYEIVSHGMENPNTVVIVAVPDDDEATDPPSLTVCGSS